MNRDGKAGEIRPVPPGWPTLLARGAVALGAVVLVALLAALASSQKARQRAEQAELHLATFDRAWELVRDRHFDPGLGGVDWNAVRDELRPRMAEAGSRQAAREVLRAMVARLGQSHFALLPAEALESAAYAREAGSAGVDLVLLGGKALVRDVAAGSPAERAGVRPGWELVRVDGTGIAPLLAAAAKKLPEGPGKRMKTTEAAARLLHGPLGARRRLELVDGEGRRVEAVLDLARPPGRLVQTGNLPAAYVRLEVERLPGDIGLLALDAFVDPPHVMRGLNEAMESFLSARGLVVDLRGNGGGLPEMVTGLLGWLTPRRLEIGRMVTREKRMRVEVTPRRRSFAGPVAVLIDERCVSGAELFAHAARFLPNARLFGLPTAGAVQGGAIERLPDGDGLMFPFSDFRTPAGESLEGVGVPPDVVVEATREDLLAGVDPALDAALAWISTQPRPGAPARAVATEPTEPETRAAAEIDPGAAQVLDAFVAATGGAEAWSAHANRVVRETLRIGGETGAGLEVARTTWLATSGRSLVVESSASLGEGRAGTVDGVAWESNLYRGTRRLGPRQSAALLRTMRLEGPARWRDGLLGASDLGFEEVASHAARHLHLELEAGLTEDDWFDPETGLLVKVAVPLPQGVDGAAVELFPSDYRWVDGVRMAHRVRVAAIGPEAVLTVEGVEHDVELPAGLFDLPEELRGGDD